jgi:hypothetical protein
MVSRPVRAERLPSESFGLPEFIGKPYLLAGQVLYEIRSALGIDRKFFE